MQQLIRLFALTFGLSVAALAQPAVPLGTLPDGQAVRFVRNSDNTYGLALGTQLSQPKPVAVFGEGGANLFASGYQTITRPVKNRVVARLQTPLLTVADEWTLSGNTLRLNRSLTINADQAGGFVSAFYIDRLRPALQRTDYELFLPGNVYGTTDNLLGNSFGSAAYYDQTTPGAGLLAGKALLIREDRLPIPMVVVRWPDQQTLHLLNPMPNGQTTAQEADDFHQDWSKKEQQAAPVPLTDEPFAFGSVMASQLPDRLRLGYCYPGFEGPMTYRGNIFPNVAVRATRPRYHPLRRGLKQTYSLVLRLSRTDAFPRLLHDNWRWAWEQLKPAVVPHDLRVARQAIVAQLSSQVEALKGPMAGQWGIPNLQPAILDGHIQRDPMCVMGFTGKALESAEFLLWAADRLRGQVPDDSLTAYRRKGEGLFNTFVQRVKLGPPNAEGYNMDTGVLGDAYPNDGVGYLRSYGDDLKATLRAIRREAEAGRQHPDWLAWCRSFGDWLLTQQRPDGGIPRSWKTGSGTVHDSSTTSGYNAIPMLVLLSQQTADDRYRRAAIRAGAFAWQRSGQRFGRFTGGTIDNPNVVDKEAATLSLEAYLALYEDTKDSVWLNHARAAADFAATWIYGWNVPMPVDAPDNTLAWKRGVSTVGIQLIATGHSLVDHYMAFDADEYARLYRYTNDPFYRDVARLLLHNSLNMTALPGRTYDLRGPGWQQEHWSLAPWRGHGFHRGWLPWVSCSHLNGIIGVEEVDKALYEELMK